jgi:BirA family biotin operon repressor/biotin-[acetyl-CoA-carboxylase] ligase
LNYIHFDSIISTNDFAKEALSKGEIISPTVVYADFQTKGRGLTQSCWHSEKSKNLLFSLIFPNINSDAKHLFRINKAVAVAVANYLSGKTDFKVSIKWSNDIYVNGKKICGTLIESIIKNDKLDALIIGIGLNINQEKFPDDLPIAVSLKNLTGKDYNIKNELISLVECLSSAITFSELSSEIDYLYEQKLLFLGEMRHFQYFDNNIYAKITGVSNEGKLLLETLEGKIIEAGSKEIVFK